MVALEDLNAKSSNCYNKEYTSNVWLFKCSKTIQKIIIFFWQKICIIFTKILFLSVKKLFFFE